MTRIIFVRHPETKWNQKRVLAGRTDVGLSAKGEKQAEQVAKALEKEPIAAVYSSPLKRTVFLAEKIAQKHGKKVFVEPALIETDFGEFEGKTLGEYYKWWEKNSGEDYPQIPLGENFNEKEAKLLALVAELCEKHAGQTIACVTHATALRILFRKLLGRHKQRIYEMKIGNASTSVWDSGTGKFEKFAYVEHLN